VKVASVLIPLPVPEAFDYEVPEGLDVVRGDQVAVPLGPRLMRGIRAGWPDAPCPKRRA